MFLVRSYVILAYTATYIVTFVVNLNARLLVDVSQWYSIYSVAIGRI